MTVDEALSEFEDEACRSPGEKAKEWLDEIEFTVRCEVCATHEGDFSAYVPVRERAGNDMLFVPEPYSVMYVYFLLMKNDLLLHDTAHYVNSASIFAASYDSFTSWYNRTHMPLAQSAVRL